MPELSVDGRRVAYLDQGAGVPVVFVHAGGSSSKQWAKTAVALGNGFRVIAPDLWGFGLTEPWTGDENLTHDHQALLVAGVIEAAVAGPVNLVGHSYGGATALRLVLARSDLVRTLTVIEPIVTTLLRLAGDETAFREYAGMAQAFLGHAVAGRPEEAWRGFIDYRNGPGAWAALAPAARERFVAATGSTVAGFHSNLNNPTTLDEIRGIRTPTLVVCGEKTTSPDRRVTEVLREQIPACRYLVIPGAEHMSPLSHPELVARAVREHAR